MGPFWGIVFVSVLIAFSILIWQLLDAIVFRFTKRKEQYGPVGGLFILVMILVAIALGAMRPGIFDAGNQIHGEWSYTALIYCLAVAGLTVIGLIARLLDYLFGRLVETIRGV